VKVRKSPGNGWETQIEKVESAANSYLACSRSRRIEPGFPTSRTKCQRELNPRFRLGKAIGCRYIVGTAFRSRIVKETKSTWEQKWREFRQFYLSLPASGQGACEAPVSREDDTRRPPFSTGRCGAVRSTINSERPTPAIVFPGCRSAFFGPVTWPPQSQAWKLAV
jgi:hypothetical protein